MQLLLGQSLLQACVITRSRQKAVDVWDIGSHGSTWYILETNYDHWKSPPTYDDRRAQANYCMKNMTQKVCELFVYTMICKNMGICI